MENGIVFNGVFHSLRDAGGAGDGHKCLECSLYELCTRKFDKAALCNINGKSGKDNQDMFFKEEKLDTENEEDMKKLKFSDIVKSITTKELLETMEGIRTKKELRVKVPDGYEIDQENSTFECIKFKKKIENYDDVVAELLLCKEFYFINKTGCIQNGKGVASPILQAIVAKTHTQLEKLLAFNKLMTVATYLNDGWEPNFYEKQEKKFYLHMLEDSDTVRIGEDDSVVCNVKGQVYFKSKEAAQKAIGILGEHVVRLALTPYF